MKKLKPILASDYNERILQRKFFDVFLQILIKPLTDILEKYDYNVVFNSVSNTLIEAIKIGRIQYINNKFVGNFNADISLALKKLGAVYNSDTKSFDISYNKIPFAIQNEIQNYIIKQQNINRDIKTVIDNVNIDEILKSETLELQYLQVIKTVDRKFTTSVIDVIGIEPNITDTMKARISELYSNNAKLYIKDFTTEQINKLRQELAYNSVMSGERAEDLANIIRKYYDVSKTKARFLGSQENRLLTSAYRQANYEDVGIEKFEWSTSHDIRVRDAHQMLNGKIFTYKDGAINPITGERIWCGSEFGCRCVDIPLV
jgi:SPP1 gp7 family putative phage head morphogenesis protein